MGTPQFAVPSLQMLVENGYNIVGVITATDKFGGRGGKTLIESDVKKYALSHGLTILQPKNLKDPIFIEELQSLNANLQIVVAFRMLPEVVWNMPSLGTYNLHGSLLPKYRGAAPIHWAVINGEKETGVTSFKLKHEIDTGDLLFQEKLEIKETDTTGDVHDRMMHLAGAVVLKTVKAIEKGEYKLKQQDNSQVTKAPKIFSEHCKINFKESSKKVFDFIRGMSPFPAAWTILDGKILKLYKVQYSQEPHDLLPGSIITDNKSFFEYTTLDGKLQILELQLQGKKKMDVKSFLNGYKLKIGA
jgi:methionyl-tRNA formyltransferase